MVEAGFIVGCVGCALAVVALPFCFKGICNDAALVEIKDPK